MWLYGRDRWPESGSCRIGVDRFELRKSCKLVNPPSRGGRKKNLQTNTEENEAASEGERGEGRMSRRKAAQITRGRAAEGR